MIRLRDKSMLFIEAHAHIWDRLDGRRLDTKSHTPLSLGQTSLDGETCQFLPPEWRDVRSPIEVFEVYQELLGIDKAVLLQNQCYGPQYDYVNAIMAKHPDRYVTVGVPDPQDKQAYLRTAELCLGEYKYKGLKFESPDTPFDMLAPENAFVFETIQKYGAICMIDLGWGDGPHDFPIHAMREVVKRYPDLTFVLPHLGVSRLWDPSEARSGFPSLHLTLEMVEFNHNIWFDISGLTTLLGKWQEYPYPAIADVLRQVRKHGAMDRTMWGSDYPSSLRVATYRQMVDYIPGHCDFLTDDELENLMGRTAEKIWFS